MTDIVFVHGRAQGDRIPKELQGEWEKALIAGLAENASIMTGRTVRFPFYGKTLDELTAGMEEEAPGNLQAKGDASGADQDFLNFQQEILEQVLANQGIAPAAQSAVVPMGAQEKGPGSWEWVQALLRALDQIPGLSSAALALTLRDVYVYLNYPKVRKSIDDIVAPTLVGDCVVVAHSLGTVITYNLLKERKVDPAMKLFLTLGSPLGVGPIRRSVMPLKHPAGIAKWHNVFDQRDVVALYPLDRTRFGVTPPISNDDTIKNATDNHHGIVEYLNKAVVADIIFAALK